MIENTQNNHRKNILVTGAAGFIASHLIEELLNDENNLIIGIDNFYSGTKENINYLNSIDKNKNFIFIEADIRCYKDIDRIMIKYNINYVYHMAAIVSVQESIENPLLSHEVNVQGTLHILESSRKNGITRVVFSSSAAVYGSEPGQPKNEYSTTKPISPYGQEKLICEEYMNMYYKLYNLETVALRYFNVYGNRQPAESDYSGVISIFNNKFGKNKVPNIYGDGEQYRDFIHVKDIVYINIQAMQTSNILGEVFCVGTAIKTSVNDVFDIMNKKYDKDFKANKLMARDGDIRESLCDNKKIREKFNIDKFKKFEDEIILL